MHTQILSSPLIHAISGGCLGRPTHVDFYHGVDSHAAPVPRHRGEAYDVEYTTPEGVVGVWVHFSVRLSSCLAAVLATLGSMAEACIMCRIFASHSYSIAR